MWKLPENKRRDTNIPIITQGWQDILYYDGPVLFTGYNDLKSRIIGSLVEYEPDTKEQKYVHAIIDRQTYARYLNKKISYYELLENAWDLFGVVLSPTSSKPITYQITFDDIPDEYRPDRDAFCPELEWRPSRIYPVSLDGRLASLHQSLPEIVAQVQEHVTGLYRKGLKKISELRKLEINVNLTAEGNEVYTPASFQMKYDISVIEKEGWQANLFEGHDAYFDYLNDYITYCLYDLHGEAPKLASDAIKEARGFQSLYKKYAALCRFRESESSRATERFRDDLLDAFEVLKQLSSTIGPFYSEIILANQSGGEVRELGIINEVLVQSIELAAKEVSAITGDVYSEDSVAQKYEVYIYALNTDSRLGFAQVYTGDKKIPKPKIKILGEGPLTGTKYTKSLYASEYIEVTAIAKRVNEVIRSMDIHYEGS